MLLAACSADSGILVAVSSSAAVEELEFQVARDLDGVFVIDQTISGQRFAVTGRDLRANPYELLLTEEQPEQPIPPSLKVLVLGRQGGAITSFALMDPPQSFIRGQLLRRSLQLKAVADGVAATLKGKGCYLVQSGEKSTLLVLGNDRDCDGFGPEDTPRDCDDSNAAINPKAVEICDGKDNNCDGKLGAPPEICYSASSGACRQGSRACNDVPGGGLGECLASTGPEKEDPYCFVYQSCLPPDPLACLGSRLKLVSYKCQLEIKGGTSCPAEGALEPPVYGPESCRWVLVDAGGFAVKLLDAAGVPAVDGTILTCAGKLLLGSGTASSGTISLEFYEEVSKKAGIIKAVVTPVEVTACTEGLICEKI